MICNCLIAALWWRVIYGGRVITRRSCGGNFSHYLHESPDGVVRQFIPIEYKKRKLPALFFRGRVVYGDYHGLCHQALVDAGYSYEQIDGQSPEWLIGEFERVRDRFGGDY